MEISRGQGGWVRFGDIGSRHAVFVRYMADGSVGELFMAASRGEAITAADLRGLPLAQISAVALSRPDLFPDVDPDVDVWAALDAMAPAKRRFKPAPVTLTPPGSRGLDDEFLQRVADAYTYALASGQSPNKALAAHLGHDNTRTVERWVYLARKRGKLGPASRGRVG